MPNRAFSLIRAGLLFCGIGLVPGGSVTAADLPDEPLAPVVMPSGERWEFAFAPYLWAAGLEGTVEQFGLDPIEIDMSFSDILENLDMSVMAVAEARRGRFGIFADIVYTDLSAHGAGPGGVFSARLGNKQMVATAMLEYRVVEDGRSSLDVMAGGRVWYVDTNARITAGIGEGISGSDTATWVDPMIGVKGRWQGASPWFVTGWGMIGGFGVSSDIDWDAMAGVGYEFNDWFSMVAGYRGAGVDYSEGSFAWDVVMHGPIVGGVIRF